MKATLFSIALFAGIFAESPATQVTVYQQGWAFFQESRQQTFSATGDVTFSLENLPKTTAANSINISSDEIVIYSRQFVFRPVTVSNMLAESVGQNIQLVHYTDDGTIGYSTLGKLISYDGNAVFEIDGAIVVNPPYDYLFQAVPEGLAGTPQVICTGKAREPDAMLKLNYLARGLGWHADYNIIIEDESAAVENWFTIDNSTDIEFRDVSLSLVAGDVKFSDQPTQPQPRNLGRMEMAMAADMSPAPYSAGASEDYAIFQIHDPVTLSKNGTSQFRFTSTDDVPVTRHYRIQHNLGYTNRGRRQEPVAVTTGLTFAADELGDFHQPAGTVRVYEKQKDGLVYVGSDNVSTVQRGSDFEINTGRTMDVTAEFTIQNFEISRKNYNSELSAHFINTKGKSVVVEWSEIISGDWDISKSAPPWERKDANTALFMVDVPANGEQTVQFSIHVNRN